MTIPPRSVLGTPPERFVPEEMGGTLLAAEHLVRYWWAASAASGADVLDVACGVGFGTALLAGAGAASATGVDLSEEAVAAARERCGSDVELLVGDVMELALPDASFDLAVCFETIEHVERPQRAIQELRRVLRPSGTLVISSPNRGVSPPGNPHHVRELTPGELGDELGRHFSHVELFAQHSWLASALVAAHDRDGDPARELSVAARTDEPLPAGRETYTVAVAGAGPTPAALARGGLFLSAPGGPDRLEADTRAEARHAHLESARADRAEAVVRSLTCSRSWRLTAPLRRVRRVLARRR